MKQTRRHVLASVTGVVAASLLGCASYGATDQPSMVLIPGLVGVPFYQSMLTGAQQEATKRSVRLSYSPPAQWDPIAQTAIVNDYVAKKVDALLIAPCDPQMLIAPLKRANDLGIKVVLVDGSLDTTQGNVSFPVASIGSDNVKGGHMAAEALIASIGGKGTLYLQNNAPDDPTAQQRSQGFKEAIAATRGAVTLVGENFDEGNISTATAQTSAILQRYPDLAGVCGSNGFSSWGACNAVENAHKRGEVKVVFFDAFKQAMDGLRNGLVDLVIGQLPEQMGALAVEYAFQALHGTSHLPKRVITGFIQITRENMDSPVAQKAIYK